MEETNKEDNNDKLIGLAMRRHLNSEYLGRYIKQPFQDTYENLCDEYGVKNEFFHIALLLIFTQIDLLGRLMAGETTNRKTQKNAIGFIRKYMGKVNSAYTEVGGLLYHALRNGLVHLNTPKRIKLKNGEYLDFSFTTIHKNEAHLSFTKREEHEISGVATIVRILVHISQLYDDLISAIDTFADDIMRDQSVSDKFQVSFKLRRIEDTEEELVKKDLRPDFEYVHSHIKNVL
jgi:hypothetical protein